MWHLDSEHQGLYHVQLSFQLENEVQVRIGMTVISFSHILSFICSSRSRTLLGLVELVGLVGLDPLLLSSVLKSFEFHYLLL